VRLPGSSWLRGGTSSANGDSRGSRAGSTRNGRASSGGGRTCQHVLVTGAAGAIGAATARAMHVAWPGVKLSLVDRVEPAALAKELGATAYVADLRDLASLPALVERISGVDGAVDGLVNCAGIMRVRDAATWSWDDGYELLAIDLLAPLQLQQLVLPSMIERGRGLIVNVSSMAGRVPLRGCAYYGAAKAGLAMASEIARADLGSRGIQVLTVYPGPVKSALEAGARADYGGAGVFGKFAPTGDPGELARRILRGVVDDEPRVVYPRAYGLGWVAPNFSRWLALAYGPPPIA
jgi:3-hydroxybutyrate dehydrogenase